MPANGLYIGIMSGTSVDGVDAVLVDINTDQCNFIASATIQYSDPLRHTLLALNDNPHIALSEFIDLDLQVAHAFSDATFAVLKNADVSAADVSAIGSHGQTIYHQPDTDFAGTLQIGDPNTIARQAGIDVVADFRRADMACGGQGAPLVPAFHQQALAGQSPRVILNLGGIANISILNYANVSGFDTGPANTLLDAWCEKSIGRTFDLNGDWSRSGQVLEAVLSQMRRDPYFQRQPPKSTGKEYFNLSWLQQHCQTKTHRAEDIQATLVELSASTIADAIKKASPAVSDIYVCGGGAKNPHLMERIKDNLPDKRVELTNVLGINSDACEAIAFAWLAYRHKSGLTGNLPAVTGATKQVILGGLYPGRSYGTG